MSFLSNLFPTKTEPPFDQTRASANTATTRRNLSTLVRPVGWGITVRG